MGRVSENLNPEFWRWLITQAIGVAFGAMVFYFYRRDMLTHAASWQGQDVRLLEVVSEITAAITKNTIVIEALHRRLDSNHHDRGPTT